jgi:hypothetical protein
MANDLLSLNFVLLQHPLLQIIIYDVKDGLAQVFKGVLVLVSPMPEQSTQAMLGVGAQFEIGKFLARESLSWFDCSIARNPLSTITFFTFLSCCFRRLQNGAMLLNCPAGNGLSMKTTRGMNMLRVTRHLATL